MKIHWRSVILLPLLGLVGLDFGCGNDAALVAEVTPPVFISPSPSVVPLVNNPPGRVYALVSNVNNGNSQLQVFLGVNQSNIQLNPTAVINLPFVATSLRHDAFRDRLYVVGGGTALNQLEIFNNASILNSNSKPTTVVQLNTTGPMVAALDINRDTLYLGTTGGSLGRLNQASQATNTTSVSFVASSSAGSPLQQLAGLGANPSADQLIATASTAVPPTPITSLPTYSSASNSSLTAASGLLTPPGLINAYDAKVGDNGRLLVLDSGNQIQAAGSSLARVMRFDQLTNVTNPANLVLSVPGANALTYDSSQNILLVPNANGTVAVYRQFSGLTGTPVNSPNLVLQTNPSGNVPDVAVDTSR